MSQMCQVVMEAGSQPYMEGGRGSVLRLDKGPEPTNLRQDRSEHHEKMSQGQGILEDSQLFLRFVL